MSDEDRQAMDNAAAEAEKELEGIDDNALKLVGSWVKRWYLTAGYKRLGRVLLKHAE